MKYNLISAGSVIAKIYRDFGIQNPDWEIDAIEWIGEAIVSIGAGVQFEIRNLVMKVENHKVAFPYDLLRFIDLHFLFDADEEGSGGGTVDSAEDRLINTDGENLQNTDGDILFDTSVTDEELAALQDGVVITKSGLFLGYHDTPTVTFKEFADRGVTLGDTYYIRGGYIHTVMETGYILLTYEGIRVDENGWPMVIDFHPFKEALMWYVMSRMMLRGWNHPNSSVTFDNALGLWEKYCRITKARIMIPDIVDLDTFARQYSNFVDTRDRKALAFGHVTSAVRYGVVVESPRTDYGGENI